MKKYAVATLCALSLLGCGRPTTVIRNHPGARGYDVRLEGFDKCYGKVSVGRYDDNFKDFGREGFFYAIDWDGDRRLDEIYLWTVPAGSQLESLVTLPEITRIMHETLPEHKKKFSK